MAGGAPGEEVGEGAAARKGSQSGMTRLATPSGGQTTTFTYTDHASFPGTLIIGKFVQSFDYLFWLKISNQCRA